MDETPNPFMKRRGTTTTDDETSRYAIAWEIRKLREMLEPFARAMKVILEDEGMMERDDEEGDAWR